MQSTDLLERRGLRLPNVGALDEWCGVARVVNAQEGRHLVAASLFWKHAHKDHGDLPEISREVMKNAKRLGLVTRFSPWEHYVQPLLEGAAALRILRPEIVFRVYLAADLEFLVEDLVEVGCEVFLMRGSSIRHNPGAMWRFLALQEEGRWITITDFDRAHQVVHDVERTEKIMAAGLGLWRVPYIFDSVKNGNSPSSYRPIIACQFGALGGYPVAFYSGTDLFARAPRPTTDPMDGLVHGLTVNRSLLAAVIK